MKLGRLFVHVEIDYVMQLPGAYVRKYVHIKTMKMLPWMHVFPAT
jgi:hypothetical protein